MWESEEMRCSKNLGARLREEPAGMESSRDQDIDPDIVSFHPSPHRQQLQGEASSSPCAKPHGYLCKELSM